MGRARVFHQVPIRLDTSDPAGVPQWILLELQGELTIDDGTAKKITNKEEKAIKLRGQTLGRLEILPSVSFWPFFLFLNCFFPHHTKGQTSTDHRQPRARRKDREVEETIPHFVSRQTTPRRVQPPHSSVDTLNTHHWRHRTTFFV